MKNKIVLATAVVVAFVLVGSLGSQPLPPGMMRQSQGPQEPFPVEILKARLKLSSEQAARIQRAEKAAIPELEREQKEMMALQKKMQATVKALKNRVRRNLTEYQKGQFDIMFGSIGGPMMGIPMGMGPGGPGGMPMRPGMGMSPPRSAKGSIIPAHNPNEPAGE